MSDVKRNELGQIIIEDINDDFERVQYNDKLKLVRDKRSGFYRI